MPIEKSVRTNFIYNIIFQLLTYAIPLITTPYASRVLGSEQIGKYSYALSIVTYFTLIAVLGSSTHGQRIIAYNRNDKRKLSQVFWNNVTFRLISTGIALFLYFTFLKVIQGNISLLEIVVSLNLINTVVDITWFFQGLEDFKQTVIRGLMVKIVGMIGIFLFVKAPTDIWKYGIILLGATILGNISLWRYVPKLVELPQTVHPFYEFKDILLVFLPTIATQVYMVLDKSMIGWITKSDYSNGCYEQSEKLVRVVLLIITSISSVILPRVAHLYNIGKMNEAQRYIYIAYRIVFFLSIPMMFGTVIISSLFIPIYLGNGYDMSIDLLAIFSILLLSVGLASVTGLAYLVPTKQQNVYTASVTIAAVVNFLLNCFMIPRIGAYGAAIASVIAETIGAVIQIVYCIKTKQLELKKIVLPSWRYYLSGSIMFGILLYVKGKVPSDIVGLAILLAVGISIYMLCVLLLRDEFIINNIFKNIKKRYLKK